MRHALTRALSGFEGSLVLVSHDRALLKTVCDEFWLVSDGQAGPFDGDLDDYLAWLTARKVAGAQAAPAGKQERLQAREAAAAERQARLARRRPLVKESATLESRMEALRKQKAELEVTLADPVLYEAGDGERIRGLTQRQAAVAAELEASEERWLAVQIELEEIGEP